MSDYNLIEAIAAALVNDNVRGKVHEFSTESLAAELIGNPNCFSIARAHLRLLDLGIELDAAQAGIECARQVEKVLIKRIAELERELVEARQEIEDLKSGVAEANKRWLAERDLRSDLQTLVRAQEKDAGLWVVARTAAEAYLQAELRLLHVVAQEEEGK